MTAKLPSKLDAHHDYAVFRNVRIPMRDGAEISADIYFPAEDGKVDFDKKYPVIYHLTPYGFTNGEYQTWPMHFQYYANENGYAFVLAFCRGTFLSDGELEPLANDADDEKDCIGWITSQSWSDRQVVTTGHSISGGTAYLSVLSHIDGVKTGIVHCPVANLIDGHFTYDGEFIDVSCMEVWAMDMTTDMMKLKHLDEETLKKMDEDSKAESGLVMSTIIGKPAEMLKKFSFRDIPVVHNLRFYQSWLDNRDNPSGFAFAPGTNQKHDMDFPVLWVSGWNDLFLDNTIRGFKQAIIDAPSKEVSEGHRLIIGPWGHIYNPLVREFPNGDTDERMIELEWANTIVREEKSEFFEKNPVVIYVMGEGRWRSEQEWPLSDAIDTVYYLHSAGAANTLLGDGMLNLTAPVDDEPIDRYEADPADPIYAPGGSSLADYGQLDRKATEMRSDMLIYSSDTLAEDVEVTGEIGASIYLATSANDTDLIVTLIDVDEAGTCFGISTGGRRARYLADGREHPCAITPGDILEYPVKMNPISYVFKKGHRIRIEICSSDAKAKEVGPNNFVDLNSCTSDDYVIATQSVYHSQPCASCIHLPIVPDSHQRSWIDPWPYSAERTGVANYKTQGDFNNTDAVILDRKDLPSTTDQSASTSPYAAITDPPHLSFEGVQY